MFEGIQELVKMATGFQRPNIKRLASRVKNPEQAGNALKSWYGKHPNEKNMAYTNPQTGAKSAGNPYLKGFKSWANSGKPKKTEFGIMGSGSLNDKSRKSLKKDMKMYGG